MSDLDFASFIVGLGIIVFIVYQFKVSIPKKKQKEYEQYIENEAIDQILIEQKKEEIKNKYNLK